MKHNHTNPTSLVAGMTAIINDRLVDITKVEDLGFAVAIHGADGSRITVRKSAAILVRSAV